MQLAGRSANSNPFPTSHPSNFIYITVWNEHTSAVFLRDFVNEVQLAADALSEWMREKLVILCVQLLVVQERVVQCLPWSKPFCAFWVHDVLQEIERVVDVFGV